MENTRALAILPLVLVSYLPACAAPEASSDAREGEAFSAVQSALTSDLTPTAASAVIDQRSSVVGSDTIDKVYDNKLSTKLFLTHDQSWIQYQLPGASIVTSYQISRSADAASLPDRVPTAWTLEASNDGIVWTQLDAQTGQTLGAPPSIYPVSNSTAYVFYRLYIKDNHTDRNGHTELAEFRIFGEAPAGTVPGAPVNVTASVNSNAISVSWGAAPNATGYIVQRVGDDAASVVEVSTTALNYTDSNLAPNTTYVYQVQAVNGTRRGPVSATRGLATTTSAPGGLKDITALSSILPSDEHGTSTGPESIAMVTDNNPYTKFYQGDGTTWLQQQAPAGSVVTQYSLTSANDFPERDPRAWLLEGSNDGTTFTTLDTRSTQSFMSRHQTRVFTCNPQALPFTYYRLTIQATQRPVTLDTQLAEWRLLGTVSNNLAPPAAPSSLSLNTFQYDAPAAAGPVVSSNQIGLKFVDNAGKLNPESRFLLERATDSNFSANFASKTVGANSTSARVVGLSPSTTYYFRVKAVNAAGSSAYSATFSAATLADSPPAVWHENGWYGHYSHDLYLTATDTTNKVRVYFDDQVQNRSSISWLTPVMGAVWKRVKDNYGSFSDPYLYVVGNTDGPGYGGGGAVNLYDPRGSFRNIPWVAVSDWSTIDWSSWDNVWKVHALTHETAHIVEAIAFNDGADGAPSVWEDSWWADIFQYDIYKNLPGVFPNVFERWKTESLGLRGDTGWYWARDWFFPLYEGQFGNTGSANQGISFLIKYLQLRQQNLPNYNGDYAPRLFTLGDFVHLCSGAAGVDLTEKAKLAFPRWTAVQDLQLARAQAEMPAVGALYRGNLAPGFTFDPIVRSAQLNVALTGQTLAGTAADPNANDALSFSKQSGPSWLTIASNGALSGVPTTSGAVTATVRVTDPGGLYDTATLTLNVSTTAAGPCTGLCTGAIAFAGPGYNSGNLGNGATCHETTSTLQGLVCGNFTAPRSFLVNGNVVTCNNQSFSPPAKRNNGYCLQATAGEPAWAYFSSF